MQFYPMPRGIPGGVEESESVSRLARILVAMRQKIFAGTKLRARFHQTFDSWWTI